MSTNAMHHADFGTIDLEALRVFVSVARERSFVAASRRSGMPPSTVSRAVARLEASLGVQLLHRTSRRVTLTADGEWLLARSGAALDDLRESLARFADRTRGEPTGLLRVTAPVATGAGPVARMLFAFAAKHPRVSIDLHVTNRVVDLVEEGFDVAFRAGPVRDEDLVARRISTSAFTLAATREVLRSAGTRKRPLDREALERLPAVTTRATPRWRFVSEGDVHEVRPNARVVVNDPRIAVDAASRGLGLVVAPHELVAASPRLVPVATTLGDPEPRDVFLVYASRKLLPSRTRAFVAWATAPGRTRER